MSTRKEQMTTRKEIVKLMRNLPTDETWLPLLMGKLKEKDSALFDAVMKSADKKLTELKEKNT
jgi:hypothetical protein